MWDDRPCFSRMGGECEYSHLLASSVTSPNQKSYTSPKWKTKQNKRMTERQEESNVNPNRDSPYGYPTVTPTELQPVTLAH